MADITIRSAGGSDISSYVAIGLSLLAIVISWYWSRRSEKRSYLDQFWFREVVAPNCLKVLEFRSTHTLAIERLVGAEITGEVLRSTVNYAQGDIFSLIDAMWVSQMFVGGFYGRCINELQSIEDILVSSLGKSLANGLKFDEAAASKLKGALTDVCMRIIKDAARLQSTSLKIASR